MEEKTWFTQKNDAANKTAISAYNSDILSAAYDVTNSLREKDTHKHTHSIFFGIHLNIYINIKYMVKYTHNSIHFQYPLCRVF
jgi:hypothetical protein